MLYCGLYYSFVSMLMPRAPKKAVEPSQPLPKPTPTPPPGPQQQLQCKVHTSTHAVLLGLGALLIASFGMNLSALAASKKTDPTQDTISTYTQPLEAKIDRLQQQLDSVSAQLLKACNDVSTSCLQQTNPVAAPAVEPTIQEPRDITKPITSKKNQKEGSSKTTKELPSTKE